MTGERVERRLTAVLAADVAGYSRLMGADEVGTLEALKIIRRDVVDPAMSEYKGRIVKTTGDGMLVEFASAVDAVTCAMVVQDKMATRNLDATTRIDFRIGINVGDIIIDAGDIFGDGVNVASRLEGLADPGGICLSRAAYDQVRDKVSVEFVDLGEQPLKNIARPVQVFRLGGMRSAIEPRRGASGFEDSRAVAVLPFDNLSKDPGEEYFVDGLTEDIITALSYWRWFPVVARNSTFAYKNKPKNVTAICKELGAPISSRAARGAPATRSASRSS
jgi:adenylate cyclase